MQGCGVDIYNLCDTGETAVSVTTYTGHSTGTGPKVVSRKVRISSGDGGVCGTLCALMYRKNCNQDNLFYIINQKESEEMEETEMEATPTPMEYLKKVLGEGKDVLSVVNLTENLLRIVASGVMTTEQAIDALQEIKASLKNSNGSYESMAEAIKDINNDSPHQQDQLNCQDDAARTLAASTHGAASHLTKTVVEGKNEETGEEVCIVRRLTPTETSRLQGFPDDYTKIDGPETSDAPQFKAHGNSWATPCANFVSTRMEMELRRLGHEGTIRYATCCSGIEAHSVAVRNLGWRAMFFSEIEPFPCRVLEKHYPEVPNLGDMTQIHFDSDIGAITNAHKKDEEYSLPSCFKEAPIQELPFNVGDLEVFSGGTPCFAKGAFVLTKNGYKPIEDIKVGEEVATHNGRFCKVLHVGKKLSSDLVEVSIVGRNRFVCTADHPFPLVKSHRHKNGEFYFDSPELTAIKDGQSLYAQIVNANDEDFGVEMPALPKVYNATESEIFELCGWYVGDGYIRGWKKKNKKAIVLCLNAKDIEVFNNHFGGRINYSISRSAGIFKVQICCTEFARFLHTHFGELAYGKKIPVWAYRKDVRESFIRGYLQTDGCFTREGHSIQWSTVSPALAFGVADIVGHTSVNKAQMPRTTVICGRTVNQRDFYSIRHNDAANHFHRIGKFDCVKVREVKKLERFTDWVYNLEVAEDHTYIVNGLVTHNCQSVSVAGRREGMAEGSGTRSSLAFHYQRIIDETRPMFTIWENVPGAFSSNRGADFIWFVNRCAESGYSMAWRVLDAQYVMTEEYPRAVPQRRRRIWLVGYRGNDWRIPARIVFEKNRALTDNPPDRIPGIGFKVLNPDADIEAIRKEHESSQKKQDSDAIFDLFSIMEDNTPKAKKVSQMIPLDEFPDIEDFAKIRMVDIFEFAKKIGEPGYLGDVFRKDKKTAVRMLTAEELAKLEDNDAEVISKYEKFKAMEKNDELQWEGAEKIAPDILENIGNAGILANGRILTMDCHEWTAGIQLSPSTYNAWEQIVKHQDWLKANDLLPEAYDETVCGLSDVLQEDPDEKYNLSWRACFGILRRAETRGKELPEALEIALISNIRENAGIVKWVALYGRDTKKKPTDMTERESAQTCFDKYIASVIKFEDVVAEQPSRKSGEIGDPDFDDEEEEQEFLDDEANEKYDNGDEEAAYWERSKAAKEFHEKRAAMPDLPNGCINESGGETAPTIVASQYKGPGNTQDATIVATKKEGRFPKEENA